MQALPRPVGAERQEMELDVGQLYIGPGPRERAHGTSADGEDAAPSECVFHAGEKLLPAAVPDIVEADGPVAGVDETHLQMVLQVLAHARKLVARGDTGGLQRPGRTDAGELQDMGRADGTRRQDHLACGTRVSTRPSRAKRTPVARFPASSTPCTSASEDVQVGPAARRAQVGDRGRARLPLRLVSWK